MGCVKATSGAQDINSLNTSESVRQETGSETFMAERDRAEKLQVAILISSFKQPAWVNRVIQEIIGSSFAEVALIVKYEAIGNPVRSSINSLTARCDSFLWDIYSRSDNQSLCPYSDPFDELDILATIGSECRLVNVKAFQEDGELNLENSDMTNIRENKLDVIIDLGNIRLTRALCGKALYGVWNGGASYNSRFRNGPPCFWEVMENESTTELTLQMSASDKSCDKVLYRSWTATDLHSVKGNRSKVYWKLANAIVRTLRNLYELGPQALEEDPAPAVAIESGPRDICPNNAQMVVFLARMAIKRFRLWFRNYTRKEQWILAYSINDTPITERNLNELQYLEPPKGKFWADPFPIERDGKFFIFFEEFLYESMKAHISVMEMDSNGSFKAPVKVLERDYHLSYPFMFEWEDNFYMIPETKGNKAIELYRCTEFPHKWEFEKTLVENVQAVDTTLFEKDGLWWLFCNIGGKDFASNDELNIFYSKTPLGPWIPHKRNPVKSDVRSSRPAGRLFYRNEDLFRPAQDCSKRMGGAMCLNRVTSLTTEDFKEELVTRIEPNWIKGLHGVHTLNTAGRLTMMDCFRYIPKSLA